MIAARHSMMAKGGAPAPAYWGLCFTAAEANVVVNMEKVGTPSAVNLEASCDGVNWSTFDSETGTTPITLASVGAKVFFRAGSTGNVRLATRTSNYHKFTIDKRCSASGNIMSLLDATNENNVSFAQGSTGQYTFANLFKDCDTLTSAPALPATTLAGSCYYGMFNGCWSLTTPPSLPATALMSNCYANMFRDCSSLIYAPDLPAITINQSGPYLRMFRNCTSLEHTGKICLSAAANSNSMVEMFYDCESLKSIELQNMTAWSNNMTDWVSGVAATGTFKCPAALGTNETITRGTSNCPTGWTVVNI